MTSYVGTSLKRFEDPVLVTGQGTFVDDMQPPGLLHAAILHSPLAHARILSIDVSKARELPGVAVVVTADDLADTALYSPVDATKEGVEMTPPPHPILAFGKVRYVGEPVAVVVAEDRYLARDALDLIRVDYEPLPPVIDPEFALTDEVILHEEIGTNIVFRMDDGHGDLEEAFRMADRRVTGSYDTQRLCPAPMETVGIVAAYDRNDDLLTVWASTQSPHFDQSGLAYMLKRDRSTIRVIAPEVGGGFGGKAVRPGMVAACYAAIKLARPVKFIEDRAENMVAYQGRGMSCRVDAAVKTDGTVLGLRFRTLCDIGAYFYRATPTPPYHMAHRITGPYKTPVVHIEVRGVATNKPTTGPYRGAGGPEAAYFMERTIDLIALDLGLDPTEVRRKNLIPEEALPYTTPTGLTYDSGDYSHALQQALDLAGYDELRREQTKARADGRIVGIGVATFIKGAGGGGLLMDSNARVEIDRGGQVSVYTEASPHGQGSETTFAQVAADLLGIKPETVSVLHSDTDMLPSGVGTMASRGVMVSGTAVYEALVEARTKMNRIAAHHFGCPEEEVVFREGRAFQRNSPLQETSFIDLASMAFQEETLPPGVGPGLEFSTTYTLPDFGFPFGAHVVLVEIDRDTGEVKLLRCVGVHDCGTIINPALVAGQVHGGLAQGFGQAISEGVVYTPDGQPATSTFLDYGMPQAEDMPELVLHTEESPSPLTTLGAKGVGEVSIIGAPAAVSNAVADALSPFGISHIDTPYTPEKIWRALHPSGSR